MNSLRALTMTVIFAVLLSGALLTRVSASEFAGGNGLARSPYIIETEQHLRLLANYTGTRHRDTRFILANDILLSANWTPISGIFYGRLDGNNHTISNLNITVNSAAGNAYAGLFTALGGAVSNLTVYGNITVSANILGWDDTAYAGGIAGRLERSARVENVVSNVRINVTIPPGAAGRVEAGGAIGGSYGGVIRRSSSAGEISVNARNTEARVHVGGLVGVSDLRSEVSNSFSYANLEAFGGNRNLVGGLVGFVAANSQVSKSYASGTVIGAYAITQNNVGGLVGQVIHNGTVEQSFSTGNVMARGAYPVYFHAVGGVAGSMYYGASISDTFAVGSVTAVGGLSSMGGIVGRLGTNVTIRNSYSAVSMDVSQTMQVQDIITVIGTARGEREQVINSGGFTDDGLYLFYFFDNSAASTITPVTSAEIQRIDIFRQFNWDVRNRWTILDDSEFNLPVLRGVFMEVQREFPKLRHLSSN